MNLAESFYRIFAGLPRSHGVYVVPPGARPTKGKLHDRSWARTVHEPVTVALWEDHLAGRIGMGIVPIRDDATCVFGAIDFDPHDEAGDYTAIDLEALAAEVARLKLPMIVCRSKSGGAHTYLFLVEPVSAEIVRSRLLEWAVLLGHPGVEVFPKQTRLASERDDGSWINIPYQAGMRSTRYALTPAGEAMTPDEFVSAVALASITEAALKAFRPPADEMPATRFPDGPPCLQTRERTGFGDWQNNGLFNIAVYLQKRHGEGWAAHLEEYNRLMMDPPVSQSDLNSIIKSVGKKSYFYMCKQEPICGVCNKQVCLTRKHGIGGAEDDPGVVFGELVKLETDPPTYIWDVDGARIELGVPELMDQRKFHALVIAVLDKWPAPVKEPAWREIVRERLARAEKVVVPEDATKEGQFWAHVQRFCTSKVRGRGLDELLMGKPYADTTTKRTYFCSADLFQYLAQHRFTGATEREAYRWLRRRGVEHHFGVLKGRGVNYWSLPSFDEQTEPHEVPRAAGERM